MFNINYEKLYIDIDIQQDECKYIKLINKSDEIIVVIILHNFRLFFRFLLLILCSFNSRRR